MSGTTMSVTKAGDLHCITILDLLCERFHVLEDEELVALDQLLLRCFPGLTNVVPAHSTIKVFVVVITLFSSNRSPLGSNSWLWLELFGLILLKSSKCLVGHKDISFSPDLNCPVHLLPNGRRLSVAFRHQRGTKRFQTLKCFTGKRNVKFYINGKIYSS